MAEATEAQLAAEKAETPAPTKHQSKLVPILIAAVVMAGAGFATARFAVVPMMSGQTSGAHDDPAQNSEATGEIVTLENIIVNPSGTMGKRYLKVTIGFEVMDEDSKEVLKSSMPRIQDALITLLSSQTVDELADAGNRDLIRHAILAEVNEQIEPAEVAAIYFLDFVLR